MISRRLLGDRSSVVFAVDGGTIGRSADNDWVLPDPLRYVSAHHARVSSRGGQYYLEDLSTNGVFVNDDEQAARQGVSAGHLLKNGDLIRMGDYQIVAALEAAGEAADELLSRPRRRSTREPVRCRRASMRCEPWARDGADRHRRDAQPG